MQNNTMPVPAAGFHLDYADSVDAFEIDRGIRDSIRGIHLSILVMGLGLANIKAKKLFFKLGCRNITAYIMRLSSDCHMDHSTIFNWLHIGEAYTKYRGELEQVGFSEDDGPYKLHCLKSALAVNDRQEVFKNIKTMSLREFSAYAKGGKECNINDDKTRWVITEKGNCIYVNGQLALIISSKISKRAADYFRKVIRVACKALENEQHILPVYLKSRRGMIRFEPEVERLKKRMKMD